MQSYGCREAAALENFDEAIGIQEEPQYKHDTISAGTLYI